MDTESELMLRLAEGDESALGRLYERLSGNVFFPGDMHMLGNREDAEEVLQDSFVNLYRSARRFDPALGSVRAYTYTIARNQARMRLRSRRSRLAAQPIEEREPVTAPRDGAAVVTLDGALSRLELDELKLLEATFFDGSGRGRSYQAWGYRDGEAVSLGAYQRPVFETDTSGFEAVGVSLEPRGGSPRPTHPLGRAETP